MWRFVYIHRICTDILTLYDPPRLNAETLPDAGHVTDEDQLQFGCPVCAADRVYAEATDARRDDGVPYSFKIYRCTVCDFQFVDPHSYPLKRGRPAH